MRRKNIIRTGHHDDRVRQVAHRIEETVKVAPRHTAREDMPAVGGFRSGDKFILIHLVRYVMKLRAGHSKGVFIPARVADVDEKPMRRAKQPPDGKQP